MEGNSYDRLAAVLAHPFYNERIRPWGGRPKRDMMQVDEKGCFIWQGCFNSKGYACRGKLLVHRAAWAAFFGTIPAEHQIHHVCGDKRCINIDHLQCVTIEEHRAAEGRPLKLNADKVWRILELLERGWSRREIAEQFDIARHHVTAIKKGRVWKAVVDAFRRRGDGEVFLNAA